MNRLSSMKDIGSEQLFSASRGQSDVVCSELPDSVIRYPELRYMGSKKRLLPWIHGVLRTLDFETAADPFCGTACVSYLMKAMGKRVFASDFLAFTALIARATIENSSRLIDDRTLGRLLDRRTRKDRFIRDTFGGIFFTIDDLEFLDRVSANIAIAGDLHVQALAYAALFRSCLKKQPRGVFTVSGDLSRYDDGRRDLRLTLEEHFLEQVGIFNSAVFDNNKENRAEKIDVFDVESDGVDLVYLDPPYVPRSDDNCYIKRYHFLEGLSCYWKGMPVDHATKVRKIAKKYTPFSYRRTACDAFDRMFERFSKSKIVLSYSANGFPDIDVVETLMKKYKKSVNIFEKPHRYHFGTHESVERASTIEYLIVGV